MPDLVKKSAVLFFGDYVEKNEPVNDTSSADFSACHSIFSNKAGLTIVYRHSPYFGPRLTITRHVFSCTPCKKKAFFSPVYFVANPQFDDFRFLSCSATCSPGQGGTMKKGNIFWLVTDCAALTRVHDHHAVLNHPGCGYMYSLACSNCALCS